MMAPAMGFENVEAEVVLRIGAAVIAVLAAGSSRRSARRLFGR
jgi:hypothetical protein